MEKKLYRSRTNKTFSGVCGGLGEYLNIDPTLVRLLWVLLTFFSAGFPGLIAYIVMACIIPEAPENPQWQPYQQPYTPPPAQGWQQPPQGWQAPPQDWQQPPAQQPYSPPPADEGEQNDAQ